MKEWLKQLMTTFPFKGKMYSTEEDKVHKFSPHTVYTWELSSCGEYVILYYQEDMIKHVIPENVFYLMRKSGKLKRYKKREKYGCRESD